MSVDPAAYSDNRTGEFDDGIFVPNYTLHPGGAKADCVSK